MKTPSAVNASVSLAPPEPHAVRVPQNYTMYGIEHFRIPVHNPNTPPIVCATMKRRLTLSIQPELNSGEPLPPRTEDQARLLELADELLTGHVHRGEGKSKTNHARRNQRGTERGRKQPARRRQLTGSANTPLPPMNSEPGASLEGIPGP